MSISFGGIGRTFKAYFSPHPENVEFGFVSFLLHPNLIG
jgi:hypothetical protein